MSILVPALNEGDVAATPSAATRTSWRYLPDIAAIGLLLLLTSLISWDRLRYDAWLGRTDLLTGYIPAYAFLGQELRSFSIPAWSPFQALGLPFAGDPQSGWMYLPVMVFYAVLSPAAATKAILVFNLAMASLSTYAFARVLGLRPIGSVAAAVSFAFGANLFHNTWCCTIWSQLSTWLPLGFLGVELAVHQRGWRGRGLGCCLTAIAVSQMMAGWMGQGVYNAGLLLGAYLTYRSLLSPPAGSAPLKSRLANMFISGGIILVLSLGLSAAGLLPRLESNRSTQLASGNYAAIEASDGAGWSPKGMVYRLIDSYTHDGNHRFYVGGVTLGLAVLALIVARRRHAVPYFAAATIAIPLLVIRDSPLRYAYELLPRYKELHEHTQFRVLGLFYFFPAMLAGAAIDTLVPSLRRRWTIFVLWVPAALVFAAIRYGESRNGTAGHAALEGALAVSLIMLIGVLLYQLTRRFNPRGPERLLTIVPVLMLLALLWEPTGRQLTEGSVISEPTTPAREASIAANLAETDTGGAGAFIRQQLAASNEPFRYFGYDAAGLRTDVNSDGLTYHGRRLDRRYYSLLAGARATRLRIYDTQGYNPVQSALYAEYLEALNRGSRTGLSRCEHPDLGIRLAAR